MTKYAYLLFLLLLSLPVYSQVISGKITNEFGEPVPFANVYVQELATGAQSDDEGNYEVKLQLDGEYTFIFSSLGYESRSIRIVVETEPQTYNVKLLTSGVDLQEITVSASDKDPAYGIIKEAIARKADYLRSVESYRTKIYVKAKEEIEVASPAAPPQVEFNMVELKLTLNYAYPRRYKEERTAYREYGDPRGLFLPNFTETEFNFYRNLVRLPGIADAPVISPLSNTSVLTYKFKLESTDMEGDQLVYKIRVMPRKTGNSTVDGWLYINGESYTVNRLEFDFPEGGLIFSDAFKLEQSYGATPSGDWTVKEQVFSYQTKQGKRKSFRGTTTLSYSDYEPDYQFPDKFFGNEVAVITQEAYERDSAYWQTNRTVALTTEERQIVHLRDSIEAVTNDPAYRDSITRLYNRVTFLDLVWDGVGFRNNRTQRHTYIAPLTSMVGFSPVGGWRVEPHATNFRRYGDGKILSLSGNLSIGLRNGDLQGDFDAWYRYDPFHLGDVSIAGGRRFESFFPNDAYLNQLKASNYYLRDALRIGQQRELFNGLYFRSYLSLVNRQPITGLDTESFLEDIVSDDEAVVDFEGYQALISTVSLAYTPGQRYLREPTRKVVLGSSWPTFSVLYRKGWAGPLGSDIDFDYLEFSAEQDIFLGALGNSKYRAQIGTFVNTADLRFVDIKRFRDSDPLLYSDPLTTFQSLDAALTTSDLYFELHHIHHFNGALINNIPLLKKTRIRSVAGGGVLWLSEGNYRYQEVFAGIERVFKIGARRRLRIGAYGVLADGTGVRPSTNFKVSFDLIDIWRNNWAF